MYNSFNFANAFVIANNKFPLYGTRALCKGVPFHIPDTMKYWTSYNSKHQAKSQ